MAILDENEFTEVEGRSYLNPQVALDESNTFIDNLRSTQQANNQQIQTDTYNLGTDISSNLGGLTSPVQNGNVGAGLSYFTSRYQVPQTAAVVANLRSVAQAQALNQALQNEQEIWKKRYNDAYRAYQKRANSGGGGGGDDDEDNDNPDFVGTGDTLTVEENDLVLPEPQTTETGVTSSMNAIADVTGQGKVPASSSEGGVLVDKNGNRTAIRVHRGEGIDVAGGASYNKAGAQKFLSDWVKNGGEVLNQYGKGNYSTNMLYWDLY